jgi:hypothetical protein
MVVVLSIFMLLIGGAVAALYFNRNEPRLNDAVREIEMLAKRARATATLQQRPYALEFTEQGVAMMPYAEALLDPEDREELIAEQQWLAEQAAMSGEVATSAVTATPRREHWMVEGDMQLLIRRWATGRWEGFQRGDRQVWRFDPEGICEPCGVRIELEDGSWIAVLFHPLTAGITETESEIL